VALSAAEKDISVKQLVEQADQAMYVAKALSGSRFEFAEDSQGSS
jgi:GGDEF domain-containing protein